MANNDQETFGIKNIHSAYKIVGDVSRLGSHPLVNLEIVEKRRQEKGRSDTPSGYGVSLQELLVEPLIDKYNEVNKSIGQMDKEKFGLMIIYEQYLRGKDIRFLTSEYNISESTYHRRKKSGFQRVGRILRRQEENLRKKGDDENYYLCLAPRKPNYPLFGRKKILAEIKSLILQTPKIGSMTLRGKPGIGKTALATELAHDPEIQGIFKDGVLWAGLGREPNIMNHLGTWALALGFSKEEIAEQKLIADRQNILNGVLNRRKMLIIIDDAWQSQAAADLQLGGQGCFHILTSRKTTVTIDFSSDVDLVIQKLTKNDSLKILTSLAPKTVKADVTNSEELEEAVDGLPLALVLLGRYLEKTELFSNESKHLRETLIKFRNAEKRLKITQPQTPSGHHPSLPDDVPISVFAIISISVEELSNDEREAFFSLSLFPPEPNTFSTEAALVVTNADWDTLINLIENGLIDISSSNRFKIHRILHDYLNMKTIDTVVEERFFNYYADLVELNRTNHENLLIDFENIFVSLIKIGERIVEGGQGDYTSEYLMNKFGPSMSPVMASLFSDRMFVKSMKIALEFYPKRDPGLFDLARAYLSFLKENSE